MSGELETSRDNSSQSQARPPWIVTVVLLIILLGGLPYLSFETAKIALDMCCEALWLRVSLWMVAAFLHVDSALARFRFFAAKDNWTGRFLLSRSESATRHAENAEKNRSRKTFLAPGGLLGGSGSFQCVFPCSGLTGDRWRYEFWAILNAAVCGASCCRSTFPIHPLADDFQGRSAKAENRKLSAFRRRACGGATSLRQATTIVAKGTAGVSHAAERDGSCRRYIAIGKFHGGHGSLSHSLLLATLWWAITLFWGWRVSPNRNARFPRRPHGQLRSRAAACR